MFVRSRVDTLRECGAELWQAARREGATRIWSDAALPPLPARLTTTSLRLEVGRHTYGSHSVDEIQCRLTRRCARDLGVVLVSHSFGRGGDTTIASVRSRASMGTLVLRQTMTHSGGTLVRLAAQEIRYTKSTQVLKNPGRGMRGPESHMPHFSLTSTAEPTVVCSGSPMALIWLGTLLLDASAPRASLAELCLESDIGFGGVARGSAEIRFILEPVGTRVT